MQLTKGAIGNLINRYKAVLKKCHLLNVFGSLAVAGMLVMGGAAAAGAADVAWTDPSKDLTVSTDQVLKIDNPTRPTTGSLSIEGGTVNITKPLNVDYGSVANPTGRVSMTDGTLNVDGSYAQVLGIDVNGGTVNVTGGDGSSLTSSFLLSYAGNKVDGEWSKGWDTTFSNAIVNLDAGTIFGAFTAQGGEYLTSLVFDEGTVVNMTGDNLNEAGVIYASVYGPSSGEDYKKGTQLVVTGKDTKINATGHGLISAGLATVSDGASINVSDGGQLDLAAFVSKSEQISTALGKLSYDALGVFNVTSDASVNVDKGGKLNIHNVDVNINGGNLNIDGMTALKGNINLQDGSLTVTGALNADYSGKVTGNLNMTGGELAVTGNNAYVQVLGLNVTGGTVTVSGRNADGALHDALLLSYAAKKNDDGTWSKGSDTVFSGPNTKVVLDGGTIFGAMDDTTNPYETKLRFDNGVNVELKGETLNTAGVIYASAEKNASEATALEIAGQGTTITTTGYGVISAGRTTLSDGARLVVADKGQLTLAAFLSKNETVTDALEENGLNDGTFSVTSGASVEVNKGGTLDIHNVVMDVNTGGSLTVDGTLTSDAKTDIIINAGGTLNLAADQFTDFTGTELNHGGTINLIGKAEGPISVADLTGKFGNDGVINAGENTVSGIFKDDTDTSNGTVAIGDINNSNVATDETKGLVVTDVASGSSLNGTWKGVDLQDGVSLTVTGGTLQLTGAAADFAVVDGNVTFDNSHSTLMLGDTGTANSGLIKGDVTFSNDASTSNMTLLVTGNQDAAFVVDGNIDGHNGTKGQLLAQSGVTLTAKGDITAGTITADGSTIQAVGADDPAAAAAGDIVATSITAQNGGVVAAAGSVTATTVKLDNGGLQAEKDITLNGNVTDASGALVAGANINATGQNLTKAADGQLSLIADGTITAKDITATNVVAKTLTTTGDVAVDGGILSLTSTEATASTVESLKLTNGTQAVIEGSLKLDGTDKTLTVGTGDDTVGGTTLSAKHIDLNDGMLLVDPAWGQASSNVAVASMGTPSSTTDVVLNGNVGVGQNSYLALGTKDTGWLPGVVAGYTKGVGLSETGVTAALGLYEGITIGTDMGLRVDGSKTSADLAAQFGPSVLASKNKAVFANNSLLVVNGQNIYGDTAAISFENNAGTLKVGQDAKLLVTDAVDGQNYTIVDNVTTVKDGAGNPVVTDGIVWNDAATTSDMISLGEVKFDGTDKVTTTAVRNDAHTVFPNLSDGMADAVNDLYTGHDGAAGEPRWDYADVNSADMGVRFLSRATDNRFLGSDKDAAAATIESAARIAFAGAVPQMTKMASDAGTNAVVNRLGFANPADGAQAMDAEGKIVDRNTTGFALWIAPLWQNQHGWGMEADSMDYGFNGNLGGVSLGADYTFENALRAGITFNIGGGYAESSGGDLNSTDNNMNFWGLGAYAGWNYENFGIMADISYTSTWNELKQDVDSRMGMGDLEADVQASAISAGLRAEYLLQTSALDIIPHIGVRYMSLNTWGFDAESNGGTVLEGDGFHQDIWTFPIGVTLSKDIALDNGFTFKPSVDFSVIPAAGDIKAKQDVAFTGLPGTYEVETQMMDYFTWQGGVGLELGNDTMSFGVNYTLQAGQHSTGHGLFGSFRYEF